MDKHELNERLLQFAISIIKLAASFQNTPEARIVRGQLARCGTSPGAQYREACRARSQAEFISKIESATQELDEAHYWLLIAERTGMTPPTVLAPLQRETTELIKIFSASARTAKTHR